MKSGQRHIAGFTLVELLVVIAIISVLAALLLPTLQRSIRLARQVSCANNQKQVYLALQMYADVSAGYYPAYIRIVKPEFTLSVFPYSECWRFSGMLLYMQCLGEFTGATKTLLRAQEKNLSKIFCCPGNTDRNDSHPSAAAFPGTVTDYGLNNTIHTEFVRRATILQPSQTYFMGECPLNRDPTKYGYLWCSQGYMSPDNGQDPRHGEGSGIGMNVLFHDGHVKMISQVEYQAVYEWQKLPWYNVK